MIRGIYAVAASLRAEITRQGIWANNLANLNTVGYKQDIPSLEALPGRLLAMDTGPGRFAPLVGELTGTVVNIAPQIDLGQGPLEATQQDLDLAILGEGFFQVETPEGIRYTRDGAFGRDAAGRLVTADGYFVLGENGPIGVGNGQVAIADDGTVYVDQQRANRIILVRAAPDATFERLGDNLLNISATEPIPANEAHIRQGFLERSNADPTSSLVAMMSVLRTYEASQRVLRIHDETLQRAIELGRPM
jgi:flagellar basal-body rod protein FlgF